MDVKNECADLVDGKGPPDAGHPALLQAVNNDFPRKKDRKPMILAIDIGNTNMEFGVCDSQRVVATFRLGTNRDITSDEVGLFASQFFLIQGLDKSQIQDVVITSVVPQVMYSVTNAIKKYFNRTPLIVGENLPFPIANLYDNPKEVGADRLVNAVAAYQKYHAPLVIVDFGTATTFDAVDADGAYLGGAIYPGIKISMDALFQKASKLPRVELVNPGNVIGKNTVNSMQSGVIYGYVGAVKNIVELMKNSLGSQTVVVATGGLSKMIGKESGVFDHIDKTLTLEGLMMLYRIYRETQEGSGR